MVAQGELWLMVTPTGKNRPALVVTRDEAIPVLDNVLVAAVTTSIRDIPTCIPVGRGEGLRRPGVGVVRRPRCRAQVGSQTQTRGARRRWPPAEMRGGRLLRTGTPPQRLGASSVRPLALTGGV